MIDLDTIEAFIRTSPMLKHDEARILSTTEITALDLMNLNEGKLCALHIPDYFSSMLADRVAEKIIRDDGIARPHIDMSYRIVTPKRLALMDAETGSAYYEESVSTNRLIRKYFSPDFSPLDRIRLELEEIWAGGARIMRDEGKLNVAGAFRYMNEETFLNEVPGGYAHIDSPVREGERVFSACFYLRTPLIGGELQIWDIRRENNLRHPALKYCNRTEPRIQNAVQEFLSVPQIINVSAGDLVIFDTGRPHAVAPFKNGERLCLQTFIYYRGSDFPLEIGS